MLENFQLAAIVNSGAQMRLLRIPLHQELQYSLSNSWNSQYREFVREISEVDFDPGYRPEQHERFRLPKFRLPHWLLSENSQTVANLDAINDDDSLIDFIRGLVALARDDRGEEVLLFQNFTRSKVIRPGFSLFLERGTYTSTDRAGLVLDARLSAAYLSAEEKLLFNSFRTVNTFLPLSDFCEEASEQEIRKVLAHPRLAVEDPDGLAIDANQWTRKRFAMLRDSRVLDDFTPSEIRTCAQEYDVPVCVSNGRVVVPSDRAGARRLLQFLCEERFRGALTETLYETNSKRRADQ